MGEIEGTYRALRTPGTRLGAQTAGGVSTLEPRQTLRAAAGTPARMQEKRLPVSVTLLDSTVETFDVEVGSGACGTQFRMFSDSRVSCPRFHLLVRFCLSMKVTGGGFGDTQ